jgi:hypothetical protein
MLRIRGKKGMENYSLLIDEQRVIGWDNLLRGKFSKQWRIQKKSIYEQDTIKRSSNARKKTKKQETKREDI